MAVTAPAPGAIYDDAPQPTRWPNAPAADSWPVGAVMITVDSTNPASRIGYGTWAAFGAGRVLAGFSAGDPDFGAAGATGGAKSITIDNHDNHIHDVTSAVTQHTVTVQSGAGATVVDGITNANTNTSFEHTALDHKSGGVSPIKTLPPFITVFFWQRTA